MSESAKEQGREQRKASNSAGKRRMNILRQVWEHARKAVKTKYRGVAQLVARLLWEQEVQSSSLCTPTKKTAYFGGFLHFNKLFK